LKSETKNKNLLRTLKLKTTKFFKTLKKCGSFKKKKSQYFEKSALNLESGMHHTCWRLNVENV